MAMTYTRGYGPNDLKKSLYGRNNRLSSKLNEVAEKGANDIKDLSVAYVPVDDGQLEGAHKVTARSTVLGNPAYDITVGGMVEGIDTDLYATWIHEGAYNLGPLSLQKAAATGKEVGPKYLERAFNELKPSIVKNYQDALKETFGS